MPVGYRTKAFTDGIQRRKLAAGIRLVPELMAGCRWCYARNDIMTSIWCAFCRHDNFKEKEDCRCLNCDE